MLSQHLTSPRNGQRVIYSATSPHLTRILLPRLTRIRTFTSCQWLARRNYPLENGGLLKMHGAGKATEDGPRSTVNRQHPHQLHFLAPSPPYLHSESPS